LKDNIQRYHKEQIRDRSRESHSDDQFSP